MKQLKSKTLSEQAYETIKSSILNNELLPGKSFSIVSMAEKLGISQTPVREAIAKLSSDGFVEGRPHKVLRIKDITKENVKQIYEVRRLLEPHAASQAAKILAPNTPLENLLISANTISNNIISSGDKQIKQAEYLSIDSKLHKAFLLSVAPFFCEVLDFVGERSLRIRTFAEKSDHNFDIKMVLKITDEHLSIIQAILDNDTKNAKIAVLKHLQNGEIRTLKAVEKTLDSPKYH